MDGLIVSPTIWWPNVFDVDVDVPSLQKIRSFFWRSKVRYAKAANKKMVAKTHVQGNVQVGADQDLLALEVGIGQIGHGLLAGRHGWYSRQVPIPGSKQG